MAGGTIVGLANRLHGFLNMKAATVDLPTVSALWDAGPVLREYVLFDLVLEILGVWTLVLVFSGLFLWWPRRSRANATSNGVPRPRLARRPARARRHLPGHLSFDDSPDVTLDVTVRTSPPTAAAPGQ